jgi:adenylate cyclase
LLREEQRRLAAILAADVAGYSRLMAANESGTLARLRRLRTEVFEPKIAQFHGRIVGSAGDSLLIEFASAVNALQCAVEIQQKLGSQNAELPEDRRMAFRMGVNLGDIIAETSGDIFGDSVNLAARLQELAEPGGVCISGLVRAQVAAHVDAVFVSAGLQRVKNFARPVELWRWSRSAAASAGREQPTGVPMPDNPSVAVLPFSTLTGNASDEFIADGFVDDLITALSHSNQLFAIARHSSFTYKDHKTDVRQIARDLGIRYIVEGSLRLFGDKHRINVQLIDGYDARHVWADTYELPRTGFYEGQYTVIRSIAASVQTQITLHEGENLPNRPRVTQGANGWLQAQDPR